jgi:hypothetical protein
MSPFKLLAYLFGLLFIGAGLVSLYGSVKQIAPKPASVADFVFGATTVVWGVLFCVATKMKYRGGFWFVIGIIFLGGAFIGSVSIVESLLRKWHFGSPMVFYSRVTFFWIFGSLFMVLGHRRHKRKKQATENNTP